MFSWLYVTCKNNKWFYKNKWHAKQTNGGDWEIIQKIVQKKTEGGDWGIVQKWSLFALRSQPSTAPSSDWNHSCFNWKLAFLARRGCAYIYVIQLAIWQWLNLRLATQTLTGWLSTGKLHKLTTNCSTVSLHFFCNDVCLLQGLHANQNCAIW
jgi:hypothetical protein